MNHPEALLVPVLMLSDYWLTVAGARLRDAGYAAHFKMPAYELNPVWQKTIAAKRWFNAKHLSLTVVVGIASVVVGEMPRTDPRLPGFFFGFALAVFGFVNGRHLGNLALFTYVRHRPQTLSGTVTMHHELVLWMSVFQLAPVLLTLSVLWIIAPTPPLTGALAGVVTLGLVHLMWMRRYRVLQLDAQEQQIR